MEERDVEHSPPAVAASATDEVASLGARLRAAVEPAVLGMGREVDACLTAVLAGGHVLLEGAPGVAKTLLVRALSRALGGSFARVQFTPDLMPADVAGTSIFHPGEGEFRFRPGPIFAQYVLCDEINRSPAKTQAALLEAMQEGSVTIDGVRHELPSPFVVFATQNPIEHEGTYPLPEAQLDRFLFKVRVDYPTAEVEARILGEAHTRPPGATPEELERCARIANEVSVRDDLPDYVVRLLKATRDTASLVLGASPRAGVMLLRASKVLAALGGRDFVTPDDIKGVFVPCLRHRVALDPAEEIEGVSADQVLTRILDSVEVPR
jgi:MoxR-like ATPase